MTFVPAAAIQRDLEQLAIICGVGTWQSKVGKTTLIRAIKQYLNPPPYFILFLCFCFCFCFCILFYSSFHMWFANYLQINPNSRSSKLVFTSFANSLLPSSPHIHYLHLLFRSSFVLLCRSLLLFHFISLILVRYRAGSWSITCKNVETSNLYCCTTTCHLSGSPFHHFYHHQLANSSFH